MQLHPDAVEAQNLLTAGANFSFLKLDRMPHTNLHWFTYPETGVLCAVGTAPTGTITVMYGVTKSFQRIVDTITPPQIARVIARVRKQCRAYVTGKFTPGAFATIEVIEADGSGRATTELRKRIVPTPGLFIVPHQGGELRSEINVGITLVPDERRAIFTDCNDDRREIRALTEDELARSQNVRTNDDIAVFYHTAEARHGLH